MTNKKFLFLATFKVANSESPGFQKWMEEEHFPHMHNTECFHIGWKKIVDENTESGFEIITYIHSPQSRAAWEIYNTKQNFRPVLKQEFREKYSKILNTLIFPLAQSAGYEIYEEEPTTNDS